MMGVAHAISPCTVVDGMVSTTCYDLSIDSAGTNVSINVGVTIFGDGPTPPVAILPTASAVNLINNGSILVQTNGVGAIYSQGLVDSIINNGMLYVEDRNNEARGIEVDIGSTIVTLINNNSMDGGWGGYGLFNAGTVTNLINRGTISAGDAGYGIFNQTSGVIDTLTNVGAINSGGSGVTNDGLIRTFNNAQGGDGATALNYSGVLPSKYNIIIQSTTNYGQLNAAGSTGPMTFNIYGNAGTTLVSGVNASVVMANRYLNVLRGFSSLSGVAGTTGSYGSYGYSLLANATFADSWDLLISLLVTGPSTANTQFSLLNSATALQNIYTLQNSVLANSFTYDCALFDKNNVCISAGGRNTAVSSANGLNNTSALLIAAYRPHPNYRIGAYADQNLSINNSGSAVNLGNNTPLIGLFGAWSERLDGTGAEVKVSAAYGQKNTTVTRSVVGSGATASEAGSGSSQLNSQGAQLTAKYGFAVSDKALISPYVGMRYTQNNMGGYTEGASSSVTAPITYSALNTNATTALAGVAASYKVIPSVTTFASVGVESDTNTANGSYIGTNSAIPGLTPVNFNTSPVRTRPTATIGAYYDIVKNQRIGVTGIYRQEPYQAVSTTTVMAAYTIGL